jgi:hypothetical protein
VVDRELPDRRQELAVGQVTGRAEDDQRARRRPPRCVTLNFAIMEARPTRRSTHRSIIQLINPG